MLSIRKRQRGYLQVALCGLLLVGLAACGNKEETPAADNSANAGTSAEASQSPSKTGAGVETLSGTGAYEGQADTTSIEVTVNGEPMVFQLGEVPASVLDQIQPGDPVTFEYTVRAIEGGGDTQQYVLTKLAKAGEETTGGTAVNKAGLPAEKNLDVILDSGVEQRKAKLAVGNGYALYVPEGFTFDASAGELTLDANKKYLASITSLSGDFKLEYQRFEGDQEVADVGRVKELKGDKIPAPMQDADLFMLGDGSVRDKEYIVKTFEGQAYVFRLDIPSGDQAKDFRAYAYAALNSIVTLD